MNIALATGALLYLVRYPTVRGILMGAFGVWLCLIVAPLFATM